MRPPNERRAPIRASLRIRSHSFSGLAPPAYEETESMPLRSTSTLAIPLPSYEEATAESGAYLTLQQPDSTEGSLSVSREDSGSTFRHFPAPDDSTVNFDLNGSPEGSRSEEDSDSEGPTIVIHPREPFLPTSTPSGRSSSSNSADLNGPSPLNPTVNGVSPLNRRPTTTVTTNFCFKRNKKPLRIAIFITLTSIYVGLLYFYLVPLISLINPADPKDTGTVTFLFIMFSAPVIMLFLNLKYSSLWTGK